MTRAAGNIAPSTTRLVTTREELRHALAEVRAQPRTVGLVPTMGALHAGHISLVDASRLECDFTVVTVFVNPTQFAPHEDFTRYPRDLAADLAALAGRADLVFAPDDGQMYPDGFSTHVEPPRVAEPLEGRCRPGHFRGVATVVMKLFQLVPAEIAYFGQKDYQQSLVVRRMVEDLNVPIGVRVCPTVRERDGLALSSRNAYLSPTERQRALTLSRSLEAAARLHAEGERSAGTILAAMRQTLAAGGVTDIDYVALADRETLAELRHIDGPAVALVAARVGATRLIDNKLIG
jgi:pantoate--beta-alanine ligase